ncbi:MAG: transposase [Xenococcaceae cyanobacterium MO_167.B27]|nr:transposase [Xenococcaceae cyanobacterium MO_167.B27]
MFVLEFKVRKPKPRQCLAIEEAIKTAQFVRNKCLRYWMDNRGVGKYDIYKYNTQLRKEYQFVRDLNSHATQCAVERTWSSISRFFDNCKKNIPGKKAYPRFKKHFRSVEYKVSGWKLSEDRKQITFTDKKGIGTLKLIVSRDLNYFQLEQFKRCRIIKRADGYYVQFVLKLDPRDTVKPFPVTQKCLGIDVGLKEFYADSNGYTEPIPQFYRKAEKQLNRANRKKSKKYQKGKPQQRDSTSGGNLRVARAQSQNYHKARIRYARKHLKVSRQRQEYCKRVAYCVIQSNDLVAYEDLNVKGMVRNRKLAKSISDAGWSTFRQWLEYFGHKYGKATVAVPPHHTSQICSNCGAVVKKSLSTRTHICGCGYIEDRDVNAAINILQKGLNTLGHSGIYAWGETPSWAVGAILLSNGDSLNQESPHF